MLRFFAAAAVIRKRLSLYNLLNKTLCFVLITIVFIAIIALQRPLTAAYYKQLKQVAAQSQLPQSQALAQQTLQNPAITMFSYLRVMRAVQFERTQLRIYPAIETQSKPRSNP